MIVVSEMEREIGNVASDVGLPCASAFSIGCRFGVPPARVREVADATGLRITTCQLGLFGYEAYGDKRLVHPLRSVPEELSRALRTAARDGLLPCAAAWQIADEQGVPRFVVGCAAETEGLRVAPCQLGCF